MLGRPTPADPEVAALTFARHLDDLWRKGRPDRLGWKRIQLTPLTTIVILPARFRKGGIEDHYYIKLGADFYDAWPPLVNFVMPETWVEARSGTRWYPNFSSRPEWFLLHDAYEYPPDRAKRQLVCFSRSAQYYQTGHNVADSKLWHQGTHTVAWTLNGLHEVLQPPFYGGRSG